MNKHLCVSLIAIITFGLLIPTIAMAQDSVESDDETATKFYDFTDGSLIDGKLKGPGVHVVSELERAKFERLISLKKSFLPKIEETVSITHR